MPPTIRHNPDHQLQRDQRTLLEYLAEQAEKDPKAPPEVKEAVKRIKTRGFLPRPGPT